MADDETVSEVEELFYRGTDLHGEGRYDEALACFEHCLELDPDFDDALLGKAMAYLERGDMEQAIEIGKQLVERNPDDALAYTNLSLFYQRAGKIAEAEEAGARARMLEWKRELAGEPGDEDA